MKKHSWDKLHQESKWFQQIELLSCQCGLIRKKITYLAEKPEDDRIETLYYLIAQGFWQEMEEPQCR